MNPFNPWFGKASCPVPRDLQVEVFLRNGTRRFAPAGALNWGHGGVHDGQDVMSYRVVEEAKQADAVPGGQEELEQWRNDGSPLPPAPTPALDVQVGGNHYKDMPIQPAQFIHANALGYFEGNVIKYVSRWRKKNGVADLEKARHYIDLLIDLESKHADRRTSASAD